MHVFVESNFVLELAFQQTEHSFCQRILTAAEQGYLTLIVPQYALTEVFQTLGSRRIARAKLRDLLAKEIEQHRREAEADSPSMDTLEQLLNNLLTTRTLTQKSRLFEIAATLARVAPGPNLTADIMEEAQRQEQVHGLSPQDALVYASVIAGIRVLPIDVPKLFITRNKNDFNKTQLVQELQTHQCELLFNFRAAAGRLGF